MRKTLHLLPILAAAAVLALPVMLLAHLPPVHELSLRAPAPAPAAPALPVDLTAPVGFAMAIKVKDIGTIAKKFVRNAQAATGDYVEGVKSAGADWEAGARAGADNFAAGVQQAIADKRFEKGISAAGAGKYATNAEKKGGQRFGPGVAAAEGDFSRGAGPVMDIIRNITLPPRRPKGDPGNQARSQAVAAALRAFKTGK